MAQQTQPQEHSAQAAAGGSASDTDAEHGGHPGVGQYVEIFVILAVLTGIEVGLYGFRESLGTVVTTPALLFLTALKFMLVVLWFMHLRFDHKLFRRVFFVGIGLAVLVFAVVASTFYLHYGYTA